MKTIYGIFNDEMVIQCVFKTEKGANDYCKHMNSDSKCAEVGLPDEFYVSTVTLHD